MREFLAVGYISQTKGLKGEVKVKILTEKEERFSSGSKFFISPPAEGLTELTVENARPHRDYLIVKFQEINSIERANALREHYLEIQADELGPQQFYIHQLIGLRVRTVDGQDLGKIIEIKSGKANDIYVIKNDEEYLIPATKQVVKEINPKEGYMVIKPTPGLLDL